MPTHAGRHLPLPSMVNARLLAADRGRRLVCIRASGLQARAGAGRRRPPICGVLTDRPWRCAAPPAGRPHAVPLTHAIGSTWCRGSLHMTESCDLTGIGTAGAGERRRPQRMAVLHSTVAPSRSRTSPAVPVRHAAAAREPRRTGRRLQRHASQPAGTPRNPPITDSVLPLRDASSSMCNVGRHQDGPYRRRATP